MLPVNRDAIGLALAELHQEDGEVDQAINVVELREPTTYAAVSLAGGAVCPGRPLRRCGRLDQWRRTRTTQAHSSSSIGVIALREQGYPDGAHEAFKEALKSRSRAPEIRHFGLSERERNYLAQGKKAQARKRPRTSPGGRFRLRSRARTARRIGLTECGAMLAALTRFRYSIWDSTMRASRPL